MASDPDIEIFKALRKYRKQRDEARLTNSVLIGVLVGLAATFIFKMHILWLIAFPILFALAYLFWREYGPVSDPLEKKLGIIDAIEPNKEDEQ